MSQIGGRIPSDPNGYVEYQPLYVVERLLDSGIIPPDATGALIQCSFMYWCLDAEMENYTVTGFELQAGETLRISNAADLQNLYIWAFDQVNIQFFTGPVGELPEIVGSGGGGAPPPPQGVQSVLGSDPIKSTGGQNPVVSIEVDRYREIWVDMMYGDNSTARRGDPNHPYATMQAAYNAVSGVWGGRVTFHILAFDFLQTMPAYAGKARFVFHTPENVIKYWTITHDTEIYGNPSVSNLEIGNPLLQAITVNGEFSIIHTLIAQSGSETYITADDVSSATYEGDEKHTLIIRHGTWPSVEAYDSTRVFTYATEIGLSLSSRDNSIIVNRGTFTFPIALFMDAEVNGCVKQYGDIYTIFANLSPRGPVHIDGVLTTDSLLNGNCPIYVDGTVHINNPWSGISIEPGTDLRIRGALIIDAPQLSIRSTAKLILENCLVYGGTPNTVLIYGPGDLFAYDSYMEAEVDQNLPVKGGTLTQNATLP